MATFNYVLGKKKDNDRYPVYLRITNRNTNTTISLDMEVVKSEWNECDMHLNGHIIKGTNATLEHYGEYYF